MSLPDQYPFTDLDGEPSSLSINFEAIESQHKTAFIEGSCDWLFHHADFRAWEASSSGNLFLHGPPGSGKSFCSREIVRHLGLRSHGGQQSDRTVVARLYISRADWEMSNIRELLQNLVQQILLKTKFSAEAHACVTGAWERYRDESYDHSFSTTFETPCFVSNKLLRRVEPDGKVFVIVDGLDELEPLPSELFIDRLLQLQIWLPFNLFLAGRTMPAILKHVTRVGSFRLVSTANQAQHEVIMNYIASSLKHSEVLARNSSLLESVRDRIMAQHSRSE